MKNTRRELILKGAIGTGLLAGGEQEPSMHQFRWLIVYNASSIVQPDMFYLGGMIRSMKVARVAEAFDKLCVPHISKHTPVRSNTYNNDKI